ncbi:helix-turn-helix transcriptional regulator [Azorhizobium oxalatiphilum]|nr:helix-turn-helix transcriptional regulator [Azorhizobium oxalatiphilum]
MSLVSYRILKAARTLLELSQDDLANAAGVSRRTVQRLENGDQTLSVKMHDTIQRTLERRGVQFIGRTPNAGEGFTLPRETDEATDHR